MSLPPAPTLRSLPPSTLTTILTTLFEPSPPLHTHLLPLLQTTSFPTYTALITTIHTHLTALSHSASLSDISMLSDFLRSHPRLGANQVDSAQSRAEQARLHEGAEEEKQLLSKLNDEYEATFQEMRYVVFVNGRDRSVIMEDMRARIDRGDIEAERREAIQAVCDIAADRAAKLQA